LLPENINE